VSEFQILGVIRSLTLTGEKIVGILRKLNQSRIKKMRQKGPAGRKASKCSGSDKRKRLVRSDLLAGKKGTEK